jgi:hypothetical protein
VYSLFMTNFSIASIEFANLDSSIDLHGSVFFIFSEMNSRKSWINLICSFTVNGRLAKDTKKLVPPHIDY